MAINLERYNRQNLIEGWQQEKLYNLKVSLAGSGLLSDFLLVDLISLGIGRNTRTGSSCSFEFEKINPEVYIEQRDEEITSFQMAELCIEDSDFVIDATNDTRSKHFLFEAAKKKNLNYFSASCSKSGLSFSFNRNGEVFDDSTQGAVNSMICAGIVADELRKRAFCLKRDRQLDRLEIGVKEPSNLEKKILQVGAGAIGTFSALALALKSAQIKIIDFDVVEESNLNRQFLFYDSIGKNKAEALSKMLEKYSRKIQNGTEKIGENFDPSGYDFVFSCVDNNQARYFMNLASAKHSVPLINGGSSTFAGNAMPYFPGKTACLDCQLGYDLTETAKEEEQPKKREIGACFHPALIIPNQIIAGLMLICVEKAISGKYEKINYLSGEGLLFQEIEDQCFSECRKNG
ncbi:MAG: ThiF family adenylyltransferase [Nanoarchaeota archaeon]|nr:ThiF family adenylyltransferase [Nanoarchaeota archaeon]MBU4086592.1 ThiF family adenylyltransferase [Nanoarchaeota archaeon]